jgi:carboxymethylenebutenolidase
MIEKDIDIPTADGAMNTFVVYPEENAPFPVVLFYMDAPGKREELHDMARRLASVGYYVVLPNLYYRRTRDYWLKERAEAGMAVMFEHMRATTTALNVRDTEAMLKWVETQPEAKRGKVGAVGYCMSGPFVVAAAANFPDRIGCIASIHGAGMATDAPDSPHKLVSKVKCESYFACAETDKWAPKSDIDILEKALKDAKVPHRIEWYPGAEHGFVFPLRAGIFHKPSAERHWERLFDLFKRKLST